MKKVAFFDFCETLVSFQTADAFVDYVRLNSGSSYMNFYDFFLRSLIRFRIIWLLNRIARTGSLTKKLKLIQIRGIKFEVLDKYALDFYNDQIRPNLIKQLIIEMERLSRENYEICIVSAGYTIYLKYFLQEFKIRSLIATEIAFEKETGRCSGTILGRDCIGMEKVRRVKEFYGTSVVDYDNSITYSDSLSDLPLLKMAGKAVVVSRLVTKPWRSVHGFSEIIWS